MVESVIRQILAEKRANRDVFQFVTSIEVAQRLHIPLEQVEKQAEEIPGLISGRTINYRYYKWKETSD